jgi:hypothetical protein
MDAFLELDVLVPEGMALEVKADEVRASLEQTVSLALGFLEGEVDRVSGRGGVGSLLSEDRVAESAGPPGSILANEVEVDVERTRAEGLEKRGSASKSIQ